MSAVPPTYAEAVAMHPSPLDPPPPLTVKLQVWHYTSQGRSPEYNEQLANLFRNNNLQDWDVVPLDGAGVTGLNSQDQYVPVEVKFRNRTWAYNDPGERPLSDVRELFYRIAPEFIYRFFIRIGSAPHNLNIFPTNVPEAFRARYTHAVILNRLNIRMNVFVVPRPRAPVTNEALSWLRGAVETADDALEILALIETLFLMNHHGVFQVWVSCARFFNIVVPEWLPELRGLFQRLFSQNEQQEAPTPSHFTDVQQAFNDAARPLQQYMHLTNRMQIRLRKLKNGCDLSNQDLYELVQDFHTATLQASEVAQKTRPLVSLLKEGYAKDAKRYRIARNASGAIFGLLSAVAVLGIWNPVGWAAFGACACGGLVGAYGGVRVYGRFDKEGGRASNKERSVKAFDRDIDAVNTHLMYAQEAVALVFSAQILQTPLDENFPDHRRREILATLGVDVDGITDPMGSQELMRDRLQMFLGSIARLRTSMEHILKDANFPLQIFEEAA